MTTVYAIVLNYNSADTIVDCVRALFRTHTHIAPDTTPSIDLRIVVVDNNSTDDSFAKVRAQFPRAEYIKNAQNVGFAAGNNVGIRFALEHGADYVVLINSDAIVTPTTITTLIDVAQNMPTPSILCPQILTPRGATWYAGARVDYRRMRITHTTHVPEKGAANTLPTDIATGCVMSIHKDVFAKIGLLNESYFLYYEDADFSVCARRAGIPIAVVPRATAVHHEVSERAARKPLKIYWLVLSGLLFCTAHAPRLYKLFYTFLIPLRRFKALLLPRDRRAAHHVRRAFADFPTAKQHYVRHC